MASGLTDTFVVKDRTDYAASKCNKSIPNRNTTSSNTGTFFSYAANWFQRCDIKLCDRCRHIYEKKCHHARVDRLTTKTYLCLLYSFNMSLVI